jgi:hypothetical protein
MQVLPVSFRIDYVEIGKIPIDDKELSVAVTASWTEALSRRCC